MGILYNRFNDETNGSTYWTLLTTFTDVGTEVPIDLTDKTELLVVCNDVASMLFCVRPMRQGNSDHAIASKLYTTQTGAGFAFEVAFAYNSSEYTSPSLIVTGWSFTAVSTREALTSVNTKVFVR